MCDTDYKSRERVSEELGARVGKAIQGKGNSMHNAKQYWQMCQVGLCMVSDHVGHRPALLKKKHP